jgi:7-cyano-7-deazaguanine synthase in queuosine biosynthesis
MRKEYMATTVFLRNASPASVPHAYQDGLILDAFSQRSSSTIVANFNTLVEQVGEPSQAGIDFLWFSAALYVADKKTPRRHSPDRWTRTFEVTTPVTHPNCWATATPMFTEALSFLTGDQWVFHWRSEQNRIWNARSVGHASYNAVCLFSGGLDSLVGAINLLEDETQAHVLLLGHYDSPLTSRVQRHLANTLAEHYGHERVQLVQIGVRPAEARLTQYAPLPAGREVTTRSRSIIFLSLGLAAASARSSGTPLYVPENGFIALNVPLVNARLGSCSTRTTHPYFLTQLQKVLAAVELDNPIVNPFECLTKGEMLIQCKNQLLLRQLACLTVSCAHPDVGRYERVRYGNCGYCFPCLIRRASLHAIDLDDPLHYTHDVCTEGHLVGGRGARGRDTRALFAALQDAASGRLTPLRSGPLPEKTDLRDLTRMYQRGLNELRTFFTAKSNDDVRYFAGL